MSIARPQVLFALGQQAWDSFLDPAALARLESFADWHWLPCEGLGSLSLPTSWVPRHSRVKLPGRSYPHLPLPEADVGKGRSQVSG